MNDQTTLELSADCAPLGWDFILFGVNHQILTECDVLTRQVLREVCRASYHEIPHEPVEIKHVCEAVCCGHINLAASKYAKMRLSNCNTDEFDCSRIIGTHTSLTCNPFDYAVIGSSSEEVSDLLKMGLISPDAIHIAVIANRPDIVALLLEKDPNCDQMYAICAALKNQCTEMLWLISKHRNFKIRFVLHDDPAANTINIARHAFAAITRNNAPFLVWLFRQGLIVNEYHVAESTAASSTIIRLLCEKNSELFDATWLHHFISAQREDYADVLETVHRCGVDLNDVLGEYLHGSASPDSPVVAWIMYNCN